MKAKLHFVFSITIFLSCFCVNGQQSYWKKITPLQNNQLAKLNIQDKGQAGYFSLSETPFAKVLSAVTKSESKVIRFPDKYGKLVAFNVIETPVFHEDLTQKYPLIRSYTGISFDKKTKVRFSMSHNGLQAMYIHNDDTRSTFIQKVSSDKNKYIIYQRDDKLEANKNFVCKTMGMLPKGKVLGTAIVDDQTLRKFRIAVSTTGEYTTYHGGTVADALAAINATLTRVNEVFETDLGVTLELIPNNDLVIFPDADTDPYNGSLNAQVQNTLTSIIGESNYDVGHLFHEDNNNGNAGSIGSVCIDNRKGSAFSAGLIPEGDNFDLDYVSHELGHQFGANHTWSFESEGTGVQAEPASGTTIMGYAGIVEGNNVAPNSDDYFHYNSIVQITDYLQTTSCAETESLTNSPPIITPLQDFIIPKGTAFVLTGNVQDSDTTDILTYAWEQIDDGVVTTNNFGPENPTGANFRSLPPSINPSRYFPKLSEVILGNLAQTEPETNSSWETVSDIRREMNFALTVRDNAIGGGQVSSDLVKIDVFDAAGPFVVLSQQNNEIYEAGSVQQVVWDVANTNLAPINAETVDIYLSIDGGANFSELLAENVANTGNANVLLPGIATTSARLMVKGHNTVFFAVNGTDFTIQEAPIVLNFENLDFEVCQPEGLVLPFVYEVYNGFDENVTFSVDSPEGLSVSFSPATVSSNNTAVTLTLSNTDLVAEGSYPLTVIATGTSTSKEIQLNLDIYNANFDTIVLLNPSDAEPNTLVNPLFEWNSELSATAYDIQIALDNTFAEVVEQASVTTTQYRSSGLLAGTNYFWRVRPKNNCGEGTFGIPFSFTTNQIDCKSLSGTGFPVGISAEGTPIITSKITFLEDLAVTDINVSLGITHSYLEDLVVTLTSPSGKNVVLLSKNCGNLEDIDAIFDDDAPTLTCANDPAISGMVKPAGLLASFNGESLLGDWVLTIEDTAPSDGGELTSFSLDVCAEGIFRPDEDEDGVFDDGDDLCLGTPKGTIVDASGCPVNNFAQDNFLIKITSESCRNNNDGSIEITANDNALEYTATLSGNAINTSFDFNETQVFQNLSAGQYSLCIVGTDGVTDYRERCFDIRIAEPEVLSVFTNLTAEQKQLTITLNGSSIYNIELNGLVTQVTDSVIVLNLKSGKNRLKITTNLTCQGSYEEEYLLIDNPILYPNPIRDLANILWDENADTLYISVYSINGQLIRQEKVFVEGNRFSMNFETLQSGVYYIDITSKNQSKTLKMVKQ
jgi:subtilisin-like proprotein convertase family protein